PSQGEPELGVAVVLLQGADPGFGLVAPFGDAGGGGQGGGDRREAGDAVGAGGEADVGAVGPRPPAPGGVDDQVDLAGGDEVDGVDADLVAPLGHHPADGDPLGLAGGGGAGGGHDGEAEVGEAPGGGETGGLVPVGQGEEHRAPVGQLVDDGGLALGEGHAEGAVDAHHLAGGAHLRAEERVDAEAVERQRRLLHRHVAAAVGAGVG